MANRLRGTNVRFPQSYNTVFDQVEVVADPAAKAAVAMVADDPSGVGRRKAALTIALGSVMALAFLGPGMLWGDGGGAQ